VFPCIPSINFTASFLVSPNCVPTTLNWSLANPFKEVFIFDSWDSFNLLIAVVVILLKSSAVILNMLNDLSSFATWSIWLVIRSSINFNDANESATPSILSAISS
jgi:hypothetical protein